MLQDAEAGTPTQEIKFETSEFLQGMSSHFFALRC
jgi:hypothetical protein